MVPGMEFILTAVIGTMATAYVGQIAVLYLLGIFWAAYPAATEAQISRVNLWLTRKKHP